MSSELPIWEGLLRDMRSARTEDANRGPSFPKHDVMQIIHNPHVLDGMDPEEWIDLTSDQVKWKSEEDAAEAIRTNSIWVAAWVDLSRPRDVKVVGSARFDTLF